MARIGTVGYLNARPLSDQVDIDRHTLVMAHPAEVARMLRDREVDVALTPVAAVLEDDGYRVVPGVCIGSEGPVSSVLLVAETPPEAWTRVVLDGVSRTSVVLARLLLTQGPLARRVAAGLKIEDAAPNTAVAQVRKGVAALVIGDAARTLPGRFTTRIDLASEWREWTGLPFVFAVWAGRADLSPEVVRHLTDAGRAGVRAVPAGYAGADLDYLTKNLRYALDDAALCGLRRFGALACAAGLVPFEDVELYPPPMHAERASIDPVLLAALDGGALPIADVVALLSTGQVAELAAGADLRRRERFPGDDVPYVVTVDLPADADPVSLLPAVEAGATRVRVAGPVTVARLTEIARVWPSLQLQGGGPADGDPAALVAAGLALSAEEPVGSLVDRVRSSRGASSASTWLGWAAGAARAGLPIAASVVVGQGETVEELAAHLLLLRSVPGLATVRVRAADGAGALGSQSNTAVDHLRAVSVARLVLPGHVRILASPETEGIGMAQASLRSGCDHAGQVDVAGVAALRFGIEEAGFRPVLDGPSV